MAVENNNKPLTSNGALVQANKRYARRKARISHKIKQFGKLRLSIFRSNENIYAQIIDDSRGITLAQANSLEKDINTELTGKEIATLVGKKLAERAKAKNLHDIAVDRNGFKYHGRIAALVDAVREAGVVN